MSSNAHSKFLLLVIVLLCLSLQSCSKHRDQEPPPIINIVILDEWNAYLLDGQRVDRDTLELRLRRMSDEEMREITGTSRARVRITSQNRKNAHRNKKNDIMEYCHSIGLDKIAFH